VPGDRENKFVLTQVSRHVEAMSYATGGGQLHSSFQRLSRLTGERGTRRVYQELGERGIDAHVYGVPDDLPRELPVTSHTDRGEEIRRSWFVAHDGGGNDEWKAALVAQEGGPNTYRGFWTFDAATVDEIVAYVTERYPPAE
jgi:DICT domain-containing protein